jgi:hypothetical protein
VAMSEVVPCHRKVLLVLPVPVYAKHVSFHGADLALHLEDIVA